MTPGRTILLRVVESFSEEVELNRDTKDKHKWAHNSWKNSFPGREDPQSKVGYTGNSRREGKSGAQVRDLQTRLGKVKSTSRPWYGV